MLAVILNALRTFLTGAMGAAIDMILYLHAVTDDAAATMPADGGKRRDRALKAVKGMLFAIHCHFKALSILIATNVTSSHIFGLLSSSD